MDIPKIDKSGRSREFNQYAPSQRAEVVKAYLFRGLSNRDLDSEILNLDADYTKGFQSMGILHYLGIKSPFKGIFVGMTINDAINELKSKNDKSYNELIEILED